MGRCLRLLLIAVFTLALVASGMAMGASQQVFSASVPSTGSVLRADHGSCPSCSTSSVVAAPSHCASSCPSLIGTRVAGLALDEVTRQLPAPAPGVRAAGRTTIPDPIPPRS